MADNIEQTAKPRRWRRVAMTVLLLLVASAVLVWVFRIPIANQLVAQIARQQGVDDLQFNILAVSPQGIRVENVSLGEGDQVRIAAIDADITWSGLTPESVSLALIEPEVTVVHRNGKLSLPAVEKLIDRFSADKAAPQAGTSGQPPILVPEIRITDPAVLIESDEGVFSLATIGDVFVRDLARIEGDVDLSINGPDFQVTAAATFAGVPETRSGKATLHVTDGIWGDLTLDLAKGKATLDADGDRVRGGIDLLVQAGPAVKLSWAVAADQDEKAYDWSADAEIIAPEPGRWAERIGQKLPMSAGNVSLILSGGGRVDMLLPRAFSPELLQRNRLSGRLDVTGVELADTAVLPDASLAFSTVQDGLLISKIAVNDLKVGNEVLQNIPAELRQQIGDSFSLQLNDLDLKLDPQGNGTAKRLLSGGISGGGGLSSSAGQKIALKFEDGARFSAARNVGFFSGLSVDLKTGLSFAGAKIAGAKTVTRAQFYPGVGIGLNSDVSVDVASFSTPGFSVRGVRASTHLVGGFSFDNGLTDVKVKPEAILIGQVAAAGRRALSKPLRLKDFVGECGLTNGQWACDLVARAPAGVSLHPELLPQSDGGRLTGIRLETRAEGKLAGSPADVQGDIGLHFKQISLPGIVRTGPGRLEAGIGNGIVQGSLNLPEFHSPFVPQEPMSLFADGRLDKGLVTMRGQAGLRRQGTPPIKFRGRHKTSTGRGQMDVTSDADSLLSLLPVLKGQVPELDVQGLDGSAGARAVLRWGNRSGPSASGTFTFSEVDVVLPDVEVSGARGVVALGSISPAKLDMQEETHISRVTAAGLSLENIRLKAGVSEVPGVQKAFDLALTKLSADLLGGKMTFDPFQVRTGTFGHQLTGWVTGIDISQLTDFLAIDGLAVTGRLDGTIPVQMLGENDIRIDDARFTGVGGGVIRFSSKAAREALKSSGRQEIDLLLQALTNFRYDHLDMKLNKGAGSEGALTIQLQGANPDVLKGRRFNLNITVSADVGRLIDAGLAIYRSSGGLLKSRLLGR